MLRDTKGILAEGQIKPTGSGVTSEVSDPRHNGDLKIGSWVPHHYNRGRAEMTEQTEDLHLSFDAQPESIGLARRASADWGRRAGLVSQRVDDLRTVVSEAVTNVVRHAYPEGHGIFELHAGLYGDDLLVVVRDFGQGLRPVLVAPTSLRLGLGLISILSSRYQIAGHEDGGTELRVHFDLTG